ncbi:hypothetical protein Hanom_Chr11g01054951 [Helianthus anomalus]
MLNDYLEIRPYNTIHHTYESYNYLVHTYKLLTVLLTKTRLKSILHDAMIKYRVITRKL